MSSIDQDTTRCPACGGSGRSRKYQIDHYDLYRCTLCRTEFLVESGDRPPVGRTYWDAYKFELYANDAVQSEYESRYESILAPLVDRFGPLSSVLDVGCGIGNFVRWAGERGMQATGVDVDDDAITAARERGLSAYHIDQIAEHVAEGSIDVITLWDVIEHVSDPRAFLTDVVRFLRPGGVVVLETPDVTFPLRPFVIAVRKVAEPIRWSDMLYYADHQTYFSGRGLSTLLGRCGLDVVEQEGMRSPSTKMAGLFDHWAERGSGAGKLGPILYKPLDATMRSVGMTNKLIMVGRQPDPT